MKVLVLGAGVIGMTTAYCLAREGHEVRIVDRNTGVGLETSYGNGGQLSYSYVAPLAGPGVLSKVPLWLLDRDSPLRFKPTLDWHQWRWCMAFVKACNESQSALTTRRLLALSFHSRNLMLDFLARESVDFGYARSGKLIVHRDPKTFAAARQLVEFQAALGCEQQSLDAEACIALEPALAHLHDKIVGAIYTPGEDVGDCYRFCVGLEALLRNNHPSVEFMLGTEVHRILRLRNRIIGVESSAGALEADCYVLTLGTNSPRLLQPLGLRPLIYPLKGYSLTLPVKPDHVAPTISITDFQRKIVYARLGDNLRVAGMADLTGYDTRIEEARVATLLRETQDAFPYASDFSCVKPWVGLRPATPTGTPILGATPYDNLWLNIGHGALGFTLALGCAGVIAELIAGRSPSIPLDGFNMHGERNRTAA